MQQGPDVSLDGREPIGIALEKAAAAAESGASSIWLATHLFARDSVSTAALILERHPSVNVVLIALSPLAIHPVQIAMIVATLDEAFPGRISLILGVGAPDDLKSAGIDGAHPLRAMAEALAICRSLLDGDAAAFEGKRFSVEARPLDHGPRNVPLLIAASGPKMLELARRQADGILLSAGSSPAFVRHNLTQIEAIEPTRPAFRSCCLVYAAIDRDPRAAFERLRPKLAMSLRGHHHAANIAMAGSRLDQEALREAVAAGRMDAAVALISDDTVLRHAVVGDAASFTHRMSEYTRAGVDRLVLAGLGSADEIALAVAAIKTVQKGSPS